jgi:hypothetical protein
MPSAQKNGIEELYHPPGNGSAKKRDPISPDEPDSTDPDLLVLGRADYDDAKSQLNRRIEERTARNREVFHWIWKNRAEPVPENPQVDPEFEKRCNRWLGMLCGPDRNVRLSNYMWKPDPTKPRKSEVKKPGSTEAKTEETKVPMIKVGRPIEKILGTLYWVTGGWPSQVAGLLFAIKEHEPVWLATSDALFGWIGGKLNNPVEWVSGPDMVTKAEFHQYLRQEVHRNEAIEKLPHEPKLDGHLYLHPEPMGGDGRALRGLLDRFCPATDIDRDLILAAILTLFWGGKPGSRPAFLIESDEHDGQGGRGTGKTSLAEMLGYLTGGILSVQPGEDFNRLMSRLMTPSALTLRVGLLDNLKTLKLSWAGLEALITCDTINGYQLYRGDARRPNTILWFLTLNGASLSKDMAQRCVIIRVKRPPHNPSWAETTKRYVEQNRWEIVGDIIALLSPEGKKRLTQFSRWASWEGEVLACVDNPVACQEAIKERQSAVDADQEESDEVRAAFVNLLKSHNHDPDKEVVFIPSRTAAEIVNEATGENRATQRVTAFLQTLTIKELRKSNGTDGTRGWRWTGKDSKPGQTAVKLDEPFANFTNDMKALNAQRIKNG